MYRVTFLLVYVPFTIIAIFSAKFQNTNVISSAVSLVTRFIILRSAGSLDPDAKCDVKFLISRSRCEQLRRINNYSSENLCQSRRDFRERDASLLQNAKCTRSFESRRILFNYSNSSKILHLTIVYRFSGRTKRARARAWKFCAINIRFRTKSVSFDRNAVWRLLRSMMQNSLHCFNLLPLPANVGLSDISTQFGVVSLTDCRMIVLHAYSEYLRSSRSIECRW